MLPYQQRVLDEQLELDTKIVALASFLNSGQLINVSDEEVQRLNMQLCAMRLYSAILSQRISNF